MHGVHHHESEVCVDEMIEQNDLLPWKDEEFDHV